MHEVFSWMEENTSSFQSRKYTMSLFKKNPNEVNYIGGKKHWTDVIKNTSNGNELLWLNPEEDFNTNSTVIVAESEEALFFKDGIIEHVFEGGKYKLSTDNYPFISRIATAFSGGISTFNCKVYFVRKAHSQEILWGTDSPIQVRDPKLGIATSIQARGSYKIQIYDSKKFLVKMVGNNIQNFQQNSLNQYFKNEFIQYIKSAIATAIKQSSEEILGICSNQTELAKTIQIELQNIMNEYGINLVNFVLAAIDIPQNDPNRQKLEAAFATKGEAAIYGDDYNKFVSREILTKLSQNDGAGLAAMGAGLGLGVNAGNQFAAMTSQIFGQTINTNSNAIICSKCNSQNSSGARFCSSCGAELVAKKRFCSNCGAELNLESKFCSLCGNKL